MAETVELWRRNCQVISSLAEMITEENKHLKPSEDGMPLDGQLAHIVGTRKYWLGFADEGRASSLRWMDKDDPYTITGSLDEIRAELAKSAIALEDAVRAHESGRFGRHSDADAFLTYLIWHEGYHYGLITTALRVAGQGLSDEWEGRNAWGVMRG